MIFSNIIERIIHPFYPLANTIYRVIFRSDLNVSIYRKFGIHCFIGGICTIVNYTLFNSLMFLQLGTVISNSITATFTFFLVFIMQKCITYQVKGNVIIQLFLFLIMNIILFIIETIVLLMLIDILQIMPLISKAFSTIIILPVSFVMQLLLVFKTKNNTDGRLRDEETPDI
jgi:putative flippase GtrA